MGAILGFLGLMVVVVAPLLLAIIALVRTSELRRRVEMLERRVAGIRSHVATPAPAVQERREPSPEATSPESASRKAAPPEPATFEAPRPIAAWTPRPREVREPDWLERALDIARGWLTEGNVPVKVGIVVLFAGVAALLKYAANQGWMNFPIEWRLAGVAAVALVGLAFGWQQRQQRRTFALSVQGGAIGVLLMTSFAAFRLYSLAGAAPIFAAWVLLATIAGVLAVRQEARALAVLGILAGFLAPVLMSAGSGNHVTLFSFYAILNAAIFAIAWLRHWRELNLLGFAFTFGIGTWWGVLEYHPEKFASTLPFLLLFFAFYLLIPVLHARREEDPGRSLADASLVFGAPLVFFSLLAVLLDGARLPLAAWAIGLSGLYALIAWRVVPEGARLLRQAQWVLAAGFATLSVPLALSARATTSVLALEGAGMVWFGIVQSRRLTLWAGWVLQLLAAVSLMRDIDGGQADVALANAGFLGALLLALAGFASAWCHAEADQPRPASAWYLWGIGWWVFAGWNEIGRFASTAASLDLKLLVAALTACLAAFAPRGRLRWHIGWTIAVALAAALPLAVGQAMQHQHPFAGHGLLAWTCYGVLGYIALARVVDIEDSSRAWAHGTWLLAWPLAITFWLRWLCEHAQLAIGWKGAATALPWLVTAAGLLLRPAWIAMPLARQFEGWREQVLLAWQIILVMLGLGLLQLTGDAAPLPWVPVFNPLELALVCAGILLIQWSRSDQLPAEMALLRTSLPAVVLFLVLTSITLRAAHQLGGVPWSRQALLHSGLAQSALSLVWSLLGVAGWVWGSRYRQRRLWRASAVLMAVVLAKLMLVDRQYLGNLPGIASFIGYGLLCTAVGYLAPAPPREPTPATSADQRS